MKPTSAKMGIKEAARAIFINAPEEVVRGMALPPLARESTLAGAFDHIHFFVTTQAEMQQRFATLANHLKPTGALWVSWPKSGQQGTDLRLPDVIRIGYDAGLVESKTIGIDSVWSAIKFTHPKPGKRYNNRYGKLPP